MSEFKRIAIFGDLHGKVKKPYYQSALEVCDWIEKNEVINDPETLLISLGDLFDEEKNNGLVNKLILGFIYRMKNKKKIIISGNHDQDQNNGSALEALRIIDNLELIEEPTLKDIEGLKLLMLPHIYSDIQGVTMEEKYSNLPYTEKIDYLLSHTMDETRSFHKKQKICDYSNLDVKQRVQGHDHKFTLDDGGNYLGSLQPNSSSEKGNSHYIYMIDLEKKIDSKIEVPKFIEYYSVEYPDSLPEIDVKYPILNITESLDRVESVKFYMEEASKKGLDLTVNRVFRKRAMNDKAEIESEEGVTYTTDTEYFNLFEKEKELGEGVSTIIRKVIG